MGPDKIHGYYCCDKHLELSAEIPEGIGRYIEKLIRDIWENKAIEKGYDPVLIQAYGEKLSVAIKKGYGQNYSEIDFKSPDYGMLRSLEENVWQFSAAKTYSQLKEMSDALMKPDGTLRTFDEFRIQSTLISGRQLRHLKTEYNTAIIGAQMAKKWKSIQEQRHLYPLLEFIAIEDDKTTPLCRTLNGVIRHVDDPFWSIYYPPNHYGCRSTVRQLKEGVITPDDKIAFPKIPEIFKVNLGQRGLAFPEDHAYFEGMPEEVMKRSREYFPYNMQFDILDVSDTLEGLVRQHFMVDTSSGDYSRLLELALERGKLEKVLIDILPTMDPTSYPAQRNIIFPDARPGKSPDLRIDRILWEEENSTRSFSINNIKHAIGAGSKQADHVIITLSEEVDKVILDRLANGRWRDHGELKEIVFRFNGMEWRYKRP